MHSSISSSDSVDGRALIFLRRATIALLVCVITLGALLEFGTRTFVYRISKNLSRIYQEGLAAAQIRGGEGVSRQVLLVGNSLLLQDVDVGELERRLSPGQHIRQFAIEATTYYDWYYGLRGLLAEGSKPDLIVVCLEPRHILYSSIRNEVFAYYLMQRRDLLDVRRSLKLTATETFDLVLANESIFYALRKEMRQVFLQRLLPELPQLTAMITLSPKPPADPALLRSIGKDRLIAFRDLAVASKVRTLLLLMPPIQTDSLQVVMGIGQEIDMPVLIPLDQHGLNSSDYQMDGYHLNERGRVKFTEALLQLFLELP